MNSKRGRKFEGVCLIHGEQLHYCASRKCLLCEKGWSKPVPKEERNAYMKRWRQTRKRLGKKVDYGKRVAKRKERKRRRVPTELLKRKRPRRKSISRTSP